MEPRQGMGRMAMAECSGASNSGRKQFLRGIRKETPTLDVMLQQKTHNERESTHGHRLFARQTSERRRVRGNSNTRLMDWRSDKGRRDKTILRGPEHSLPKTHIIKVN